MLKTVRIGTLKGFDRSLGDARASLFCRISVTPDGRLSITGVEGPRNGGNCAGGCGQVVMHAWEVAQYAPGWDAEKVAEFRAVWDRWHLNDMTAGSPAQEAHLRAHPVAFKYPESHYTKACEALAAAGLNPDPAHLVNGKPYSYGSAWLREELPAEVVAWLEALPDSDLAPAWV